jgi:hypothetical protein
MLNLPLRKERRSLLVSAWIESLVGCPLYNVKGRHRIITAIQELSILLTREATEKLAKEIPSVELLSTISKHLPRLQKAVHNPGFDSDGYKTARRFT